MRPTALTVTGFRSYAHEVTFDLERRSLFAIVGPTGAGKSSVLDAIAYALYGKTPRVKTGVKRLICTRCDEARVRLLFESDGVSFQIVRALPRAGSGEHVLTDLSSGQRTVGADAVTERVTELLGLDFDAFCSSVLLAQGKFAQFLEASPGDRTKILKGVFRFDRIDALRAAAKERVTELAADLREIEGERRGIPEDLVELLRQAKADAKAAAGRAADLEKAIPEEKQLEESIGQARADAEKAGGVVRAAEEAIERIPAAQELEAMGVEEAAVVSGLVRAREQQDKSDAELARATKSLVDIERTAGTEAVLTGLGAKAEERASIVSNLAELRDQRNEFQQKAKSTAAALKVAERAEKAAKKSLESARTRRRDLEERHRAHALRGGLKRGEPCPVCEQTVTKVPSKKAPPALQQCTEAEEESDRSLQEAMRVAQAAKNDLSVAQTRVEDCDQGRARAEQRLGALDQALAAALGTVAEPLVEIEARLARLVEIRSTVDAVANQRDAARDGVESFKASERDFVARRNKVAAALIEIAGRVGITAPVVDAPSNDLAQHAGAARAALGERADDARSALEKANLQANEATGALSAIRERLRVEDDSIAAAFAQAKADVAVAERQSVELERAKARGKELDQKQKEVTRRERLFAQLADDLTDRHFVNYLLEERRRLLSELASERLRAMTSRYRFDDDATFTVVDELDGDKRRDVATLSGGETFLASLALALGLADAVTRHGGRLECFFLDEGFGSLDPEAFDLALDGIEHLASSGRLIGLVSHVPALAARVDDVIELERSDDGVTVVKGAL
jgi:exonuclease SbcC